MEIQAKKPPKMFPVSRYQHFNMYNPLMRASIALSEAYQRFENEIWMFAEEYRDSVNHFHQISINAEAGGKIDAALKIVDSLIASVRKE